LGGGVGGGVLGGWGGDAFFSWGVFFFWEIINLCAPLRYSPPTSTRCQVPSKARNPIGMFRTRRTWMRTPHRASAGNCTQTRQATAPCRPQRRVGRAQRAKSMPSARPPIVCLPCMELAFVDITCSFVCLGFLILFAPHFPLDSEGFLLARQQRKTVGRTQAVVVCIVGTHEFFFLRAQCQYSSSARTETG